MLAAYLNDGYASADVTVPPVVPVADGGRRPCRRRVQGGRGTADDHRAHLHHRQRQDQGAGDRAGAAVQDRRAARPRGADREPAPAERPRSLPAHPDLGDLARRPVAARRDRRGRGGAADHHRRRRRSRGRSPPSRDRHRHHGRRRLRVRAARVLRNRPAQSRRPQSLGQSLHPAEPASEHQQRRHRPQSLRLRRVSRRRHLPRAARAQELRRPDRHRRGRAGRAHRLQLRPQGLQRRPVAPGLADGPDQRALLADLHACLRLRREPVDDADR